jgi:hypothetical protein
MVDQVRTTALPLGRDRVASDVDQSVAAKIFN